MKKRWIIWVAITLATAISVSVLFYNKAYESNIEVIQTRAQEIETLNKQLQQIAARAEETITYNKEWRVDSLSNDQKSEEFQTFLDAVIYYLEYSDTAVAEVDQHHKNSIRAKIKTSPVFENDCVQSQISVEYDYNYQLIEHEEKLLDKQSYIQKQKKSLVEKSLVMGMLAGLAIDMLILSITKITKAKGKNKS